MGGGEFRRPGLVVRIHVRFLGILMFVCLADLVFSGELCLIFLCKKITFAF